MRRVEERALTGRVPASIKRRFGVVRERDALRVKVRELRATVAELEERLDHERLFPAEWADRRVRDKFGGQVQSGPFAGMAYPDDALGTVNLLAPKLLGVYELELHDEVERLIAWAPQLVVNVGAADGYYAVGVARRLPDARVVAFDVDEARLAFLGELAELNGVRERVEIVAAACDHEALTDRLGERAAVVCDCDGCEAGLLDPQAVPALRAASLIVEVHDHLAPGTNERLREAFGGSHDIVEIDGQPRRIGHFPQLDFMPWVTRQLAIAEFRAGQGRWLALSPRE